MVRFLECKVNGNFSFHGSQVVMSLTCEIVVVFGGGVWSA